MANEITSANKMLSKLFLNGGEYEFSDLSVTFGCIEMLLDDSEASDEAKLAAKCASLGRLLLLGGQDYDYELVREAMTSLRDEFGRYARTEGHI